MSMCGTYTQLSRTNVVLNYTAALRRGGFRVVGDQSAIFIVFLYFLVFFKISKILLSSSFTNRTTILNIIFERSGEFWVVQRPRSLTRLDPQLAL